jgi:2-keto-4-pentenoate hydratase/2-oxohepta-3-ene-1,7-dioic acid hydratase in catechol pathway
VRLAAPFPRPIKNVLCLGVNYRAHDEAELAVIVGKAGQHITAWSRPFGSYLNE